MKMKQFIHAVFCALTVCGFLLLGASCSKENEPVQTVEGVTVTIAAQSEIKFTGEVKQILHERVFSFEAEVKE